MHQLITYLYMCHSYSRQFRGDCLILHDFHHYLQHRRTSHHQYHLIATRVNGLCECAYKCDHYCSHNIAGHQVLTFLRQIRLENASQNQLQYYLERLEVIYLEQKESKMFFCHHTPMILVKSVFLTTTGDLLVSSLWI